MKRRSFLGLLAPLPWSGEVLAKAGTAIPPSRPVETAGRTAPLLTGIEVWDHATGGIESTDLICVGGRPCTGKTRLAMQIAARLLARYRRNVVFTSAMESTDQLVRAASNVAASRIVAISHANFAWVRQGGAIEEPGLYVWGLGNDVFPFPGAVSQALRQKNPWGCALLIVDGWTSYPCEEEIQGPGLIAADDVANAKRVAVLNEIPAVYLFRTAWHERQQKDPRMADLHHLERVIEQMADKTALLHRRELYYSDPNQHHRGRTEMIVRQRRWGKDRTWQTFL